MQFVSTDEDFACTRKWGGEANPAVLEGYDILRCAVFLHPCVQNLSQAVVTLVTRGRFLTSASKFNIEPSGGIFDVSRKTTSRHSM